MATKESTPSTPSTPEELEGKTKAELSKLASKEGVEVTSKMTKGEIVENLQSAGIGVADTPGTEGNAQTDDGIPKKLMANPVDDPERFGGRLSPPDAPVEEPVAVAEVAPEPPKPEPVRNTETAADRLGRAALGR